MPVDFLIIVAALQIGEDCVGAVEIFQRPDAPREARPGFLQFVEQMTGHASRYLERRQTASITPAESSSFLADFEQFMLQLQRGENVPEVAATAANDGRQLLGCDRLSVAVHKGKKTSIVAISGQDKVNARANLTRAMAAIASRIVALREPLTFSGKIENLPPKSRSRWHTLFRKAVRDSSSLCRCLSRNPSFRATIHPTIARRRSSRARSWAAW